MNHWEIQLWWHNKTLTGPPHHTEIECATPERTTHIFIANSFLSTQLERQTPGKTYFAIFLSDSFSFQMLFSCWLVHVTNNQQRFLFCFVLFFKFSSSSSGTQLSLLANKVTADKRNKANGQPTTTTTRKQKKKNKKTKIRDVGSGSCLRNFFIYYFFLQNTFFSFAVSLAANSIRNDGPQRDRPPFRGLYECVCLQS